MSVKNVFRAFLLGLCILLLGACGGTGESDRPVGYFAFRSSTEEGAKGSLWGIMREDGEIIFSDVFENEPMNISEGRFTVEEEEGKHRYYMLEDNPRAVSGELYAYVTPFENGVAIVSKEIGDPKSIIDKQGFTVVPALKYRDRPLTRVWRFSEGYALFQYGERYGFIDQSGEVKIEPKYADALFFRKGVAAVLDEKYLAEDGSLVDSVRVDVIARSGKKLSEYPWSLDMEPHQFMGDMIVVGGHERGLGLQDIHGKTVLAPQPQWQYITEVKDGLLVFYQDIEDRWSNFGLAKLNGEVLLPAKYSRLHIISSDRLLARDESEYHIIDLKGQRITMRPYDDMHIVLPTILPNGNVVLEDKGMYYLVSSRDGNEVRTKLPIAELGMGQFARDLSDRQILGVNYGIMEW